MSVISSKNKKKKNAGTDQELIPCISCKKKFQRSIMTFGPSPFASEIHNDYTPHWMCAKCLDISADDI